MKKSKQIDMEDVIKETIMTEGNNSNYPPNSEGEANEVPQDDQTKDLAIERRLVQQRQAHAINTCLQLETQFKLYSYRIIEHESFVKGVDQICKEYVEAIK